MMILLADTLLLVHAQSLFWRVRCTTSKLVVSFMQLVLNYPLHINGALDLAKRPTRVLLAHILVRSYGHLRLKICFGLWSISKLSFPISEVYRSIIHFR